MISYCAANDVIIGYTRYSSSYNPMSHSISYRTTTFVGYPYRYVIILHSNLPLITTALNIFSIVFYYNSLKSPSRFIDSTGAATTSVSSTVIDSQTCGTKSGELCTQQ